MGSTVSQLRPEEVQQLAESTNFSEAEIRRLYRRFCRLDKDGSGSLDTDELASIPELSMNPLGPRILGLFDSDGDGTINFPEFLEAMSVFCDHEDMSPGEAEESRNRKLDFVFRVFDVDGDGRIGAGELHDVFELLIPKDAGVTPEQIQQVIDRTLRSFEAQGNDAEGFYITKDAFNQRLRNSDTLSTMGVKFQNSHSNSFSMDSATMQSEYEIIETLGKGSFGVVTKVRRKRDGQIFACKEVAYGNMSHKEKELLVQEVNILRCLQHPNIVRYVDRYLDKSTARLCLIQEFCPGGDLASYIKSYRSRQAQYRGQTPPPGVSLWIREEVILTIASQLLSALSYCHNREGGTVLHRDLKPGNVFMSADNTAKLGDFGLARTLSDGHMATTNVGTPLYMSPEQTKGLPYDEKCDVWAMGCILYEMAALQPPFLAKNQPELFTRIRKGVYQPIPSRYSRGLSLLISDMLMLDPASRPSVSTLLSNPVIQAYAKEQSDQVRVDRLRAREAALVEKERQLRHLERQLKEREAALEAQERALRHEAPTSDHRVH